MARRKHKPTASAVQRAKANKAFADPLRIEIHRYLLEHSEGTPAEIARALGAGLENVTYHTKYLADHGRIEFVGKRISPEGRAEGLYRSIAPISIDTDEVADVGPEALSAFADDFQAMINVDIDAGRESGAIAEQDDRILMTDRLMLDEQGWADLQPALMRVWNEVVSEVKAESGNRLAKSGEDGFRTNVTLMLFPISRRAKE